MIGLYGSIPTRILYYKVLDVSLAEKEKLLSRLEPTGMEVNQIVT
jgi:hypothetical protein